MNDKYSILDDDGSDISKKVWDTSTIGTPPPEMGLGEGEEEPLSTRCQYSKCSLFNYLVHELETTQNNKQKNTLPNISTIDLKE